jgi:hypothetical protein
VDIYFFFVYGGLLHRPDIVQFEVIPGSLRDLLCGPKTVAGSAKIVNICHILPPSIALWTFYCIIKKQGETSDEGKYAGIGAVKRKKKARPWSPTETRPRA